MDLVSCDGGGYLRKKVLLPSITWEDRSQEQKSVLAVGCFSVKC